LLSEGIKTTKKKAAHGGEKGIKESQGKKKGEIRGICSASHHRRGNKRQPSSKKEKSSHQYLL
jgi:hypothetical protein